MHDDPVWNCRFNRPNDRFGDSEIESTMKKINQIIGLFGIVGAVFFAATSAQAGAFTQTSVRASIWISLELGECSACPANGELPTIQITDVSSSVLNVNSTGSGSFEANASNGMLYPSVPTIGTSRIGVFLDFTATTGPGSGYAAFEDFLALQIMVKNWSSQYEYLILADYTLRFEISDLVARSETQYDVGGPSTDSASALSKIGLFDAHTSQIIFDYRTAATGHSEIDLDYAGPPHPFIVETTVRANSERMFNLLGSFVGEASTVSQSVPEPSTLAIFALGLAGLGFARRKRAA